MDARRVRTYDEYQKVLDVDDDEFAALFDTGLINVTTFFRDPETWQFLADQVVPAILEQRSADMPLRAWVAGCATGEEAYTVAILLSEALGDAAFQGQVKIYATDADASALAAARLGRYPRAAVTEAVPPALLERCFTDDGADVVFRKDPRRSVIFGRHDLVVDPPISRIDLLTCRNTLIYFTPPTQTRILRKLHFALRPSGFLLVGQSEALATRADLFAPFDFARRVFRPATSSEEAAVAHDRDDVGEATPRSATPDRLGRAFEVSPVPQAVLDAGVP